MKGKVAVFLINDPDFVAAKGEDAFGKFGGRTMTYYGRWTYKFEEAARRGAVAALIVHDAMAGMSSKAPAAKITASSVRPKS